MAPVTIPSTEPTRVIAGDTWRWDRSVDGYTPGGGWSLTYAVRGKGTLTLTGAANAANTAWEITAPSSQTAALPAGVYEWVAFVTSGSERYTVLRGSLTVEPNLVLAKAGDRQTHEERMLEAINARLEGRIEADMEKYQLEARLVERIPFEQLLAARSRYAFAVRLQRNGGRTPQGEVQFARP